MKKLLATLMLAAMILSTGCGNNTMDGAKRDAQDAAQKVDEVKADVQQKVDEVRQDARQKVDEVRQDARQKVDEVRQDVAARNREVAIGGIKPGMSFDEAKAILGEPSSTHDDDEFIFANGLQVETKRGVVEEVKITRAGVKSAQGVEVGMGEHSLGDMCGAADAIERDDDDGDLEYKYLSGDKNSKIVYTARDGRISEITCSLRD